MITIKKIVYTLSKSIDDFLCFHNRIVFVFLRIPFSIPYEFSISPFFERMASTAAHAGQSQYFAPAAFISFA